MSSTKRNAGGRPSKNARDAKKEPTPLFSVWERNTNLEWSLTHKELMSSSDCHEIIAAASRQRPGVIFLLVPEGDIVVQDGPDFRIIPEEGGQRG